MKISKILLLFIIISVILSFIYLKPFLDFKDTLLLRLDWHQQFQYTAATWITLTEYNEFPFWNPYVNGGNFLFAYPLNQLISLQTLFVLLFGMKGLFYSVFFMYALGFVGCYFLGRYFKLSFLATLYLAVVFTFQSHAMNYMFLGSTFWVNVNYIPFMFYFYLKSQDDIKYAPLAGLFHALIYFDGSPYVFVFSAVFLAVYALCNAIIKKDLYSIKAIMLVFIFSFLIGSPKILASFDIYTINQRDAEFDVIPFNLNFIKDTFMGHQTWDIVSVKWIGDKNFHFPHYGSYIGIVPIILATIGLFLIRDAALKLTLIAMLLLYLSNFSILSPVWEVLHSVFPFTILQRQAKIIFFVVVIMGVIGAKLISKLSRIRTNVKWQIYLKNILIIVLIAYIFVDLTKESHMILSNFKPLPMQEGLVKWDDNFEYYDFYERLNLTKEEVANLDANYFKSFEHIDTLSNKGTKNRVLDPMGISGRLGNSRVSSKGEPEYRGEYYFMDPGAGSVKREKWSPNKIKLKVKAEREDILVINQNFHKHWKVKEGFEMVNLDGLLGIKIPKGEHEVNVYVFQNKILIGLFLSLIGVISGAYLLLGHRNRN